MANSTYLTITSGVTQVESADGKIIQCSYLDHPRFLPGCALSAGLHYLFVRFASDRTYSKVYELRTAINTFLDYVFEYEKRNPEALHLKNLLHISAEVFNGYDSFNKKNNGPKGLATRLKGALCMVAQGHNEGMPMLTLPVLDNPRSDSYEPLTEICFNQLSDALKSHIDYLYKKIEFRRVVDSAEPYIFEEIFTPSKTLRARGNLIRAWVPEVARSLKSLILNSHPFVVPYEEFVQTITTARMKKDRERPDPTNIVELIYIRYGNMAFVQNAKAGRLITLDELFEHYYPNALDQAAIVIFIQLQTGWNKETVMALDGNNFEHVLTGAFNSSLTLITSEKQKSQSTNKPYLTPKTFLAPSSKEDKYSAYNLIKLAKELSAPLSSLPLENKSDWVTKNFNPLFLCMRDYRAMTPTGSRTGITWPGRFLSVASKSLWEAGIRAFFEKYEVRENGARFASAADLEGRLRPTWIRFVRDKKDRPLSVVALQQGHRSIETTDVHYDSSGPAMQQRRKRLRIELNDVAKLLRERKFKGMIGKRDDNSLDTSSFRIFTIPGHGKSLWACSDSFKPDWPGNSSRIPVGAKCSEIPQCLFCSRVCVFEDSLPFLMKRQATIQEQLEGYQEPAFDKPMADELEIIDYILSEWGDERALKEAARYLRKHPELLPSDMGSLSILFED